jgi:SsrA-binding protein
MKIIAKNKKAFFDYDVLETLEAGIVLSGAEVKSLRTGQCTLPGAYAIIQRGELFLLNANIPTYSHLGFKDDGGPTRTRKLLVHRRELGRLVGDIARQGVTLVALSLYFNDRNLVKVSLGICKHKKAAGKKQAIKERDIKRETAREIKDVYRY